MVYQNDSANQTLEETDGFSCMGYKLEGYDDMNEVKFEVGPGQIKVLKFVKSGGFFCAW